MRTFVIIALLVASVARAQGDDWSSASTRGDVHSPGWDAAMKAKGEPMQPRFPEIGKGIERHVLDNGLVVYLAEDHRLPLIKLDLSWRGGEYYEDGSQWGVSRMTGSQMREGGTESMTPDQLDDRLAFLAASVATSFGEESGSASLDSLSKNFNEALQIFADVVLRPRFDEGRLEIAKRRSVFALQHQNDDPGQILSRELATLLYGPEHPRGRQMTPDRVNGITRAMLVDAHRRFVVPNNAYLAVVGDFDGPAMLAALRTVFGGWNKGNVATIPWPAVDRKPKAGVYLVDRPVNQSNIAIAHLGVDRDEPDRYAIDLMNTVLGGGSFSSRITERVRSDEGLAYSAGSRFDTTGREVGLFQATVQTKTETTAKAIALMLDEIGKIRKAGSLSKNEFGTTREARLYSQVFRFEDLATNVSRLIGYEREGRPMDTDARDHAGYVAVTPAAVEAAAKEHLRPEALTIFVVGNAKEIGDSLKQFGPVTTVTLKEFTP